LVTILVMPFVTCSARYQVYLLFCAAFFPRSAALVTLSLYLWSVATVLLMGRLFRRTLFPGGGAPFVLELPPYRMPTLRGLLLHTWHKGRAFVERAGTIILAGVILVWAAYAFPRQVQLSRDYAAELARVDRALEQDPAQRQGLEAQRRALEVALQQEQVERRWAGRFGKWIEPVLRPLGFDWRCGVSLLPGFVAKEVTVGSMAVLYGAAARGEEAEDPGIHRTLVEKIRASGTFTPLVAYTFLIFTLLYVPCLSTVGVIRKETGRWSWAAFSIVTSVLLAYLTAFAVYRAGLLLGLGP
jgi:ferrous iron transport protein B